MPILQPGARRARDAAAILNARRVVGRVLLVDCPRLAAHLSSDDYEFFAIAARRSQLRKSARPVIAADALPLASRSFAAAIVSNLLKSTEPGRLLAECSRVVRAGGPVLIFDRGDPTSLSALSLCAGLVDVCQQGKGRSRLTVGYSSALLVSG